MPVNRPYDPVSWNEVTTDAFHDQPRCDTLRTAAAAANTPWTALFCSHPSTWSRGKIEERGTSMASEMLLRRINSICRLGGGERRPRLFGRGEGLRRLVSPASHPSFCSNACEQATAGSASKVRPLLYPPNFSQEWMRCLFSSCNLARSCNLAHGQSIEYSWTDFSNKSTCFWRLYNGWRFSWSERINK